MRLPLVNQTPIVSSCKRRRLLRVFTLHSKLKGPNKSIHGHIKFFKCIFPQAGDTLSLPLRIPFFLILKTVASSPSMFSPLFTMSSRLHVLPPVFNVLLLVSRLSVWLTYVYVSLGYSYRPLLKMPRSPRKRYRPGGPWSSDARSRDRSLSRVAPLHHQRAKDTR